MFEIFTLSNRNGRETRLLTPYPSKSFFYVGSLIWNIVRDLIKIYEFSIKSGPIKSAIFLFLFNTYFTSVVPTALLLQCNWPITGIRRVL